MHEDTQGVSRSTNQKREFKFIPVRPRVKFTTGKVTQSEVQALYKKMLDGNDVNCRLITKFLAEKPSWESSFIDITPMVVLMDLTAQGKDDAGRICNGPECGEEESSRIDPSLLESIPSSIPTSCIYRYQDFIATPLADGFYGNIYKVQSSYNEPV